MTNLFNIIVASIIFLLSRPGKVASLLAIVSRARKKLDLGEGKGTGTVTTAGMTAVDGDGDFKGQGRRGGQGKEGVKIKSTKKSFGVRKDKKHQTVSVLDWSYSDQIASFDAGLGQQRDLDHIATCSVGDHSRNEVEVEVEVEVGDAGGKSLHDSDNSAEALALQYCPQPNQSDLSQMIRIKQSETAPIISPIASTSIRNSFSLRPPPSLSAEGTPLPYNLKPSPQGPIAGWTGVSNLGGISDLNSPTLSSEIVTADTVISRSESKKKRKNKITDAMKDKKESDANSAAARGSNNDATRGPIFHIDDKSVSKYKGRIIPSAINNKAKVDSRLSNKERKKEQTRLSRKKEEEEEEAEEDSLAEEYRLLRLKMERKVHATLTTTTQMQGKKDAMEPMKELELARSDQEGGRRKNDHDHDEQVQKGDKEEKEEDEVEVGGSQYYGRDGECEVSHAVSSDVTDNESSIECSKRIIKGQGRIQMQVQAPSSSSRRVKVEEISGLEEDVGIGSSVSNIIAAMSAKDILSFFQEQDSLEEDGWNSGDDEDEEEEEEDEEEDEEEAEEEEHYDVREDNDDDDDDCGNEVKDGDINRSDRENGNEHHDGEGCKNEYERDGNGRNFVEEWSRSDIKNQTEDAFENEEENPGISLMR